jgi:thiopeptide-type bacteriocin biosynthesis protein
MNKHSHDTWLSIHLFYNEPWEDFLQKAIEPYVNTAVQTGIAQQYFFIRYWEKGPHVRLRLKGDLEMINSILKPNLEEHFNHYFESKPSRRIEPNYPPGFSENLKWYPNNTLRYSDYEPEFGRYGGPVGVALCEKQFFISSQTVLEFIKLKGKTWSYDDAMGIAIKLHLIFIHAAGLSIDAAISFFDFYAKNWLPYTFKNLQQEITEEDFEVQSTLSIRAFEESFESQKASLISFHSILWNTMEEGDSFDEEILNKWLNENKLILNDLFLNEKEEGLSSRTAKYDYQVKPTQYPEKELIWSILVDCIHMTNNRLGIFNRDESYLSFMMMRCLEEIKKDEKIGVEV